MDLRAGSPAVERRTWSRSLRGPEDLRRQLAEAVAEGDRLRIERAEWEAQREAERGNLIGSCYGEKSDPAAGLVFKTIENATLHAPQPEPMPSDNELDDYSKGIAEFVVEWTRQKLAPRDAKIARLETQVEMLITLLGERRNGPVTPSDSDRVVEIPKFLRKVHDAA